MARTLSSGFFGGRMRLLILCAILLIPQLAYANDIHVHVDYRFSEYRVSPDPGRKTSSTGFDFVMHPNGSIEESLHAAGPHPKDRSGSHKLGDRAYSVINEHTISVRGKRTVTTIKVTGTACEATVEVTEHGEYVTDSTELGVRARYRDLRAVGASCTIR
jgi:hypothetical protein